MPGAERSIAALVFENDVGLSSGPDRRDGQHVRQAGGELERVALLELVAGRGDRDRAGPDRLAICCASAPQRVGEP